MAISISNKTKEEIITARCDSNVKKVLHLLSESEHLSMSEIITKSIFEYHNRHFPDQSFFEVEKELFGKYGSGRGDLSIRRRQYLKEMLSGKHRRN